MKVVFDTNVLLAGLMFPKGQAAKALSKIVDGADQLVLSRAILDELLTVLARKFEKNADELAHVAVFLHELASFVSPTAKLSVLADEPDNRILECAVKGRVNVIVTGDKAMLDQKVFAGIRIITLRRYLEH